MLEKTAKEQIKYLSKKIREYNRKYYNTNLPTISDAEYDYLFNELQTIETQFPNLIDKLSPTQTVGAPIEHQELKKHQHKQVMLSLSNAFTDKDITYFIDKIKNLLSTGECPEIFCEQKIDGIAFSIIYKRGRLLKGSTRGDGYIGEDITQNIKTIANLPLVIDNKADILEIRGEIFINKKDFNAINLQQHQEGKDQFANPRNLVAGSIRHLNKNIPASRALKYFVYAVGYSSSILATSQLELLSKFKQLGFVINSNNLLTNTLPQILQFYNNQALARSSIPYEIDGVVYKINDFSLQKRLGHTARTPKFAIAYKFPALSAKTQLLNIIVQISRAGVLTPVAELQKVSICGVQISRATLHNFQEIKRLDLRIGDTVVLHRAGDVIPKIIKVDLDKRPNNATIYPVPSKCISCNSDLNTSDNLTLLRCTNRLNCPKQLAESIRHFVSKKALNIKGLGPKQINLFTKNNMIREPLDIFHLESMYSNPLKKIENMPGFGKVSVRNLFSNISKAKQTTLPRFIYSLGIPHVGENCAKIISKKFTTAENFMNSMIKLAQGNKKIFNELKVIHKIGTKIICDIKKFFESTQNVSNIESLLDVIYIKDTIANTKIDVLSEKNIVFTGKLSSRSRNDLKIQAELLGATVTNYISSATNLVVAGKNSGSKLEKAMKLKIKILSEEEWIQIIEKNEI